MPLVHTDGGRFCFLVDTGATFNVLMKQTYDQARDIFGERGKHDYLIGMEGDPKEVFAADGALEIGGRLYPTSFGVLESTEAMDAVRILTGRRIDGALGVDFLRRYGLVMDFTEMSLRG